MVCLCLRSNDELCSVQPAEEFVNEIPHHRGYYEKQLKPELESPSDFGMSHFPSSYAFKDCYDNCVCEIQHTLPQNE